MADYSSASLIPNTDQLVGFTKTWCARVVNPKAVLYFTYGDVTAKDGAAMITFTQTFFNWVSSIAVSDASVLGTIGVSYDVDHMSTEETRRVLEMCRDLRKRTAFGETNLKIKWTIEEDRNIFGTDLALKLADSALVMLYSNYIESSTFSAENSPFHRLRWLLNEQCKDCLNDSYARTNYRAKITVTVEASCEVGRSCSWASFCAYDNADRGAYYLASILQRSVEMLAESGSASPEQYNRLFNVDSPFAVHNFEWYRCYEPFGSIFGFPWRGYYHTLATGCRCK